MKIKIKSKFFENSGIFSQNLKTVCQVNSSQVSSQVSDGRLKNALDIEKSAPSAPTRGQSRLHV